MKRENFTKICLKISRFSSETMKMWGKVVSLNWPTRIWVISILFNSFFFFSKFLRFRFFFRLLVLCLDIRFFTKVFVCYQTQTKSSYKVYILAEEVICLLFLVMKKKKACQCINITKWLKSNDTKTKLTL